MKPDADFARHFAQEWVAAWNAHDLPRILSHYREDFEMHSPLIAQLAGEPSGCLRGHGAVGAYWARALELLPELRFELADVLLGADGLVLYYRSPKGWAAESFVFDDQGRVAQARAHYAVPPAGA